MKKEKHGCHVLGKKILKWFALDRECESFMGDVEECYLDLLETRGANHAKRWYWFQIVRSIWIHQHVLFYWRLVMLNNYIKITLRNIRRHKGYSLINIAGLAIGMACCILIFLYVYHELGYDRYHKNADHVYRVIQEFHMGEQVVHAPRTSALLAPAVKEEIHEVKYATSVLLKKYIWKVRYKDKIFNNDYLCSADPDLLKIFTFQFLQGDPESALDDPSSIILTRKMKDKYFGHEDPMGKTVMINDRESIVTGVIKNLPENSHIHVDGIIPFMNRRNSYGLASWNRPAYATYILLRENSSIEVVNQKMNQLLKRHLPDSKDNMTLQHLKKIHLHSSHLSYDYALRGESKYITIFSLLASFILIIACINFTNLSTARSSTRTKEIGMRKVLGAEKKVLIKQFFGESLFITFIAFIFAYVIVVLALPNFNHLSGKNLSIDIFLNPGIILGFAGIILIVGGLSGIYPALLLSAYRPTAILKGINSYGSRKSWFRKVLVSTQFTLSVFLIISMIAINRQMQFIKNRDLGYNKENLVIFGLEYFRKSYDVIRSELLANPNIVSIGRGIQPIYENIGTVIPEWEGKDPNAEMTMESFEIGYDYFETYEIELVQGRNFSREFSTDRSNYIVNASAAEVMGLESPVGTRFRIGDISGTVIGVVKDFNHSSLHHRIRPMIFKLGNPLAVAVRIRPENEEEAMSFLKAWWKNTVPDGIPFDGKIDGYYLESKIDGFYFNENRLSKLVNTFTVLSLFIACLGLFGLVSFSVEQRTKEIGIRKVHGATISGIFFMLSKEFTKLIILTNIIAWPIAYFAMDQWLQNFAYRIHLGVWIFVLSAAIAFLIAFFTVSYQAVKAAITSPVETLRYE